MNKLNAANLKKTFYYLKRNGLKETWYAAAERLWGEDHAAKEYIPQFVSEEILERQRGLSEEIIKKHALCFSIVVPTYRTDPVFLREMIDSVRDQSYPGWELILADATEGEGVKSVAESFEDGRIVYRKLEKNKGISENTNAGIRCARGDYIGLLDHDDILEPDALYEMAAAILQKQKEGRKAKLLYSDEDKCSWDRSRYYEPNLKVKFNLDLILSNNYICHFMMMESALMKRLELRKEFDGAQDYDLVLRAVSELKGEETAIVHVPRVLYHWRCHESSTAENPQSKLYAYEAGKRALQDFADQNGYQARAVSLKHLGFYGLEYEGDIFEAREDLGAVCGCLIRDHRICGGCMDESGNVRYAGLKEHQSGYLHRAVLSQDTEAADLRCIRIAPRFREAFEKITGVPYMEDGEGFFDPAKLPKRADLRALSLEVSRMIRGRGARILYLPQYARKLNALPKRAVQKESHKEQPDQTNREDCDERAKVTVVIPNYNGIRFLAGCMESLAAEQEVPGTPRFKILVVDNHSTDGSRQLLKENWSGTEKTEIEKIFLDENTGFCHAVNLGIKKSDTPYVILLNNDTKVLPGFVGNLYRSIQKRKNTFSVSAKMLMWDDPELLDDAGDQYCVFGWAYGRGKGKRACLYDRAAEVFSACGGAAIYKKEIFDRIGLFDERHFAYLEDLDMGYRARIFGYRNFYEPKAAVIHYGSASTGSRYNEKKTVLAAENNVYVIFKNMPAGQRILNLPFLLAGFMIKFLFFSRKKMGRLYLKGLWRGLKKSLSREGRAKRIAFQGENLGNYLKIQFRLYANIMGFLKKS